MSRLFGSEEGKNLSLNLDFITAKPLAVRMGRGKGKISIYTAPVKKGTILFEIFCLDKTTAYNALKKAGYKLPIQTKIILNFKLS